METHPIFGIYSFLYHIAVCYFKFHIHQIYKKGTFQMKIFLRKWSNVYASLKIFPMSIWGTSCWESDTFDKHFNVTPSTQLTKKPHVIERDRLVDCTSFLLYLSLDELGILSSCNQPWLIRHTGKQNSFLICCKCIQFHTSFPLSKLIIELLYFWISCYVPQLLDHVGKKPLLRLFHFIISFRFSYVMESCHGDQ